MKIIRGSFTPASQEIINKELSDKEEKFAQIWVVLTLFLVVGLFTVWILVFTLELPLFMLTPEGIDGIQSQCTV